MRKVVILLAVVAVSAVVYAQVSGDPEPTTDPNVKQVEVTNFPAEQAVTGTVEVSNIPAVQEVTGTVEVSNLPSTAPVMRDFYDLADNVVVDGVLNQYGTWYNAVWVSPEIDSSSFSSMGGWAVRGGIENYNCEFDTYWPESDEWLRPASGQIIPVFRAVDVIQTNFIPKFGMHTVVGPRMRLFCYAGRGYPFQMEIDDVRVYLTTRTAP